MQVVRQCGTARWQRAPGSAFFRRRLRAGTLEAEESGKASRHHIANASAVFSRDT
jgi:hypothetical protein